MKIETKVYEKFQCTTVVKDTPVVSLLITADLHTKNDQNYTATAMLLSDLMLAGAGKFNRDEFLHAVSSLGSNIYVSENDGRVTVSVKSLANNLNKTLKLLETALTKPTFSSSEYKRALKTTKNSLLLYKDEARVLAQDALKRSIYGANDRHYRFEPDKIIEALDKMKLTEIKNLHQKFLTARWSVSVGGDEMSVNQVLQTVEKLKKKQELLSEGNQSIEVFVPKNSKFVSQSVTSKQNVEFSIGGYLPLNLTDKDLPAFTFGLAVLGKWGGFAGRLMSTVREMEGLTYLIYARMEGVSRTETGYWRILTFFSPQDAVTGMRSTLREIKKIQKQGISDSELTRFKDILKTGETLVYDSLTNTVGLAHNALVSGIYYEDYKKYQKLLYSVDKAEVNRVLKKYLKPENIVVSAAGPIDKKLAQDLKLVIKK